MRIATLTALLLVTEAPVMAQEADRTPQQDNGSDTSVSLLAGADYISGDFDDRDYETYAVSAGLSVRSGRFSLTASVPYVSTTAPEDLIVGNGGVLGLPLLARPSTERREVTRDGIGDVVVGRDLVAVGIAKGQDRIDTGSALRRAGGEGVRLPRSQKDPIPVVVTRSVDRFPSIRPGHRDVGCRRTGPLHTIGHLTLPSKKN